MKVFVTGATGVLGRSVIPKLLESDIQVKTMVRSAENVQLLRNYGVETAQGSLFDLNWLKESTRGCDAILHLATKIPPSSQMKEASSWDENNKIRIIGTKNLVEAALATGVRSIIYPSVTLVYPDSGGGWVDATSTKPRSASFLQSTLNAESEVSRFTTTGGRGISLRMGTFYGAESTQTQEAYNLAKEGHAFIPGSSRRYLSSIWIDDAAEAVVAALLRGPAGLFDVVDDNPMTKQEMALVFAEAVARKTVRPLPAVTVRLATGAEVFGVASRSQRVSNKRFKDATGWSPRVISAADGWSKLSSLLNSPLG